jgi:hypothetical protein
LHDKWNKRRDANRGFEGVQSVTIRGGPAIYMPMAVVLVAASSAIWPGSPPAQVTLPVVRVVRTAPFTVLGSHFRPGERVHIVVRTGAGAARTVTATTRGGFLVRFAQVRVGTCPAYWVTAIGGRGSRASVRLRAIDCPPPQPLD